MKKKIYVITSFLIAIFLFTIFIARDLISPYLEKYIYKLWPPKKKIYLTLTKEERKTIDYLSKNIKGMLVWASNREGNREIYLLKLPQKILKNLTNHSYQDSFPKFSPDGNWISFLRSQREWVSFREEDSWDIYVINLKNGTETFLAQGNHPRWTKDSHHIIFKKDNKIYKINIDSKKTNLLFNGDNPPVNGHCGEPSLSSDETKLALVIRTNQFNGIGIVDLKTNELKKICKHRSCNITFSPDYNYLYWVRHGGKGETQIFYSPVDNPAPSVFMDLPSEYSHEYFPRISNDGKWLIWGASTGGHEHDIADYEIFLWKIGTPWEDYIRFTYSEANDNWPDLYIPSDSTM